MERGPALWWHAATAACKRWKRQDFFHHHCCCCSLKSNVNVMANFCCCCCSFRCTRGATRLQREKALPMREVQVHRVIVEWTLHVRQAQYTSRSSTNKEKKNSYTHKRTHTHTNIVYESHQMHKRSPKLTWSNIGRTMCCAFLLSQIAIRHFWFSILLLWIRWNIFMLLMLIYWLKNSHRRYWGAVRCV